ncbi:MAG: hypothetical protein K8T89_01995 [Planctomycetes bacterium]|nr:hypothetical protein [Planctomycetota bacterium]
MIDPYREWLGMSDDRRPPTLYALLGVSLTESNPRVIESAAGHQMAKVQLHLTGPHSKEAWRLVDEITMAKTTLLDPAKRAAYDSIFGFGLKGTSPAASHSPPPQTPQGNWGQPPMQAAPQQPANWYAPQGQAVPPPPATWQVPQGPPPPAYQPAPMPQAFQPPVPPKRANTFDLNDEESDEPGQFSNESESGEYEESLIKKPRQGQKSMAPLMIGGGVVAVGLIVAGIFFATRGGKPSEHDKKSEVADNSNDKNPDDSPPKTNPPKTNPKKVPTAKKPPKNDPPPPTVIAEEFKEAKIYRGHAAAPRAIAVSADGKQLLTAGDDQAVFSWTPAAEKAFRRLTLKSPAIGIAFLPNGREAVAADGGMINVIDLATNNIKKQIPTVNGGFQTLVAGREGQHILLGSSDGYIRWWDVTKTEPDRAMDTGDGNSIYCVALSADGRTAAAGGKDGSLSLWDVKSGSQLKKWKAHAGDVTAVAFSPDDKHLVSTGSDLLGKIWEVPTGKAVLDLKGPSEVPVVVAWSLDGKMIFTGGGSNLYSWDPITGKQLRWSFKYESGAEAKTDAKAEMKTEPKVTSLALDPKDRFLIAGFGDGGLQMLFLPSVRPDSTPRGAWVQAPKQPAPAPLASSVASAVKLLRDKLKADYAQTAPDDLLALYDKLLIRAQVAPDDPVTRYALFQEARDLAGKLGRMEDAFKAIEARAAWFASDELADKTGALKAAAQGTVTKAVAEAAVAVVEDAEKLGRPDIVDELFRQRELFPQAADTPELTAKIVAAEKRWTEAGKERETSLALATELQKTPNDPKANLEYGKYLCFRIGEWTEGLPKLVKGEDMALREIAKNELANPKEPKSQIEIAKAWFDYAAKAEDLVKAVILLRAEYWYNKAAMGNVQAIEKLQIASKLSEIKKQIKGLGSVAATIPGEPIQRKGFNTVRTKIAVESQWVAVNTDPITPEGLPLKDDAALTSRFYFLDGCLIEFMFVPDGRELKMTLNGESVTMKPVIGSNDVLLSVQRKGPELLFMLKSFSGTVLEEKTVMLMPNKLEPTTITLSVLGAADKDGLKLKSATVTGPVKPTS